MGIDDPMHAVDLGLPFPVLDISYVIVTCGAFFFPSLLSSVLRDLHLATFLGHLPRHCQALPSILSKKSWSGSRSGFLLLWVVLLRPSPAVPCFTIDPCLGAVDVVGKAPNQLKQVGLRIKHIAEWSWKIPL